MGLDLFTIGGYNHSEQTFFGQLLAHKIEVLVDVRQRRGMRGSRYSFLNAVAMQQKLAQHGINYLHLKELAPTNEIREAQKVADSYLGASKRQRLQLSDAFVLAYQEKVLDTVDRGAVMARLSGHQRICFFCVEGPAGACHRSLIVSWLSAEHSSKVRHIGGGHGLDSCEAPGGASSLESAPSG